MIGKYFNLRKAIVITILLTGFSAGAVFAQETEVGVVINGVRWATRNLDVGGTFVDNPEDYGALFQWGRLADGHESRTSGTTDELSSSDRPGHDKFILALDWRNPQNNALWNAGTEDAPLKSVNDPSPEGWRVPTETELASLLDETKVTRAWDAVNRGYTFTDNGSGYSLFLPAAGFRDSRAPNYNGELLFTGNQGYYWSSTPQSIDANYLKFGESWANMTTFVRTGGMSLRCVAESITTSVPTVPAEDAKTITGIYSITGQRLGSEPQSGFYIVVYDNGTAEKRMK